MFRRSKKPVQPLNMDDQPQEPLEKLTADLVGGGMKKPPNLTPAQYVPPKANNKIIDLFVSKRTKEYQQKVSDLLMRAAQLEAKQVEQMAAKKGNPTAQSETPPQNQAPLGFHMH